MTHFIPMLRIVSNDDQTFSVERGGTLFDDRFATGPEALRAAYYHHAWPGGYPVGYLDQFNNVICADCAHADVVSDGTEHTPHMFDDLPEGIQCDECGRWIMWPDDDYVPEVDDPTDMPTLPGFA